MIGIPYSNKQEKFLAQVALVAERESTEGKGASGESRKEAEQLLWQVEQLQRQLDEAGDEREGLLREIDFLKDASEKVKERGTCASRLLHTRIDCTARQRNTQDSRNIRAMDINFGSVFQHYQAEPDDFAWSILGLLLNKSIIP